MKVVSRGSERREENGTEMADSKRMVPIITSLPLLKTSIRSDMVSRAMTRADVSMVYSPNWSARGARTAVIDPPNHM